MFVVFICGISIGFAVWGLGISNDGVELAQSICDQEYDMDYDSYDDGVLKCKPKDNKAEVQYDGIVIQIGDER